MSTPYVGEIRMFGFPRIPTGWLACDGSLQSIAEYDTLYTLLGTTYGGDGQNTFALPDLRGRIPVHSGQGSGLSNYPLGMTTGSEQVTLLTPQIPQHSHVMMASTTPATTNIPGPSMVLAAAQGDNLYATFTATPVAVALAPTTIGINGQTLPHQNCMATLTTSYCIAWAGTFPSRS
jgi:microcystin-dependent protein